MPRKLPPKTLTSDASAPAEKRLRGSDQVALQRGSGKLIGLLFPRDASPLYGYFREVYRRVQNAACSEDFGVVLVNPDPTQAVPPEEVRRWPLAGWLMVALRGPREHLKNLSGWEVPVTLLSCRAEGVSQVDVDNQAGALQAMTHLMELGHERIGHLRGPQDDQDAEERWAGYQEALRQRHLEFKPSWVAEADFSQARAYEATQQLLRSHPRPTALFAANDMMALGAIAAAQDLGLSVPEDLAVVGFDDVDQPSELFKASPLTTVRQPVSEMAREAVELLLLMIESGQRVVRERRHSATLIVRASCGARLATAAGGNR